MTLTPPPAVFIEHFLPTYRELVERWSFLLREFPLSFPTSWFRDPHNNARVGGSPDSQHLFGFAADFDTPEPQEFAALARELDLIPVIEFDHVHVQGFPAGALRRAGFFR